MKQKLSILRNEYYMQEEHLSKLAHALRENEDKLTMQSAKCTREGFVFSRLIWRATKPRRILEKLTSKCADDLHDLMGLVETCIYAFSETYGNDLPSSTSDEYQYIVSLCGILTNLSSIPDGRLFLVWNPLGRAIYNLILDKMEIMHSSKAGSLKWIVLIGIYNILVNPFGRKLVLNHKRLRQNLAACLTPANSCEIIGATLHIVKVFVDDINDDQEMFSFLMEQLPLEQIYTLSKHSKDISIRKTAHGIIINMAKAMEKCCSDYKPPRRSVRTGTCAYSPKPQKTKINKAKARNSTKAVMTSSLTICAECESDVSIELIASSENDEETYCYCELPPDPTTKNEICDTPSLKAKGSKKIIVRAIMQPASTKGKPKSEQLKCCSTERFNAKKSVDIVKAKSSGKLCCSSNKLNDATMEIAKAKSSEKLKCVTKEAVIEILSKLDLEKYLRSSYTGVGIPLVKSRVSIIGGASKELQKGGCEHNETKLPVVRSKVSIKKSSSKGKPSRKVSIQTSISRERQRSSDGEVKGARSTTSEREVECICPNEDNILQNNETIKENAIRKDSQVRLSTEQQKFPEEEGFAVVVDIKVAAGTQTDVSPKDASSSPKNDNKEDQNPCVCPSDQNKEETIEEINKKEEVVKETSTTVKDDAKQVENSPGTQIENNKREDTQGEDNKGDIQEKATEPTNKDDKSICDTEISHET